MGWGWHDSLMFGGLFMWIVCVLLIAGVAWRVATLVAARGRPGNSTGISATDIVKGRCARGEIDRTECEKKLQVRFPAMADTIGAWRRKRISPTCAVRGPFSPFSRGRFQRNHRLAGCVRREAACSADLAAWQ
jgi:hypothetical protein